MCHPDPGKIDISVLALGQITTGDHIIETLNKDSIKKTQDSKSYIIPNMTRIQEMVFLNYRGSELDTVLAPD